MAGRDRRVMADLKAKPRVQYYGMLQNSVLQFGSVSKFISVGYLLTDVAEATVSSVTLVRFSQNRVEGFVAIPPGRPGISRDGEHCHVHLQSWGERGLF